MRMRPVCGMPAIDKEPPWPPLLPAPASTTRLGVSVPDVSSKATVSPAVHCAWIR